jgi:ABC-type phosphate transport system ATPase subunit
VIITDNMQKAACVATPTAFMLDGELVGHGPTNDICAPKDEGIER